MDWVWKHSQSKGNARLALLAVADQARTSACEVRMSHADFVAALNASKSVVKAAVRSAAESGELEVVELGKGTRSSLYRLPKAAGYVRSVTASGPESGPLETKSTTPSGSESGPLKTNHDHASGPESGTEWAGFRPSSGPESGPHYQSHSSSKQEREPDRHQPDHEHGIPEWARPLVDGLTNAGVIVRWPFKGTQWFPIHALIKKSGTPAMVKHAVKVASRTSVESAKYFMQGWSELPPLPQEQAASRDTSNQPPVPDWCGKCDSPDYRWLENGTGYVRCRNCNPDAIGATP